MSECVNEGENKALPYGRKGHLINIEGMIEVSAHHQTAVTVAADVGRNRRRMPRPWKEVC